MTNASSLDTNLLNNELGDLQLLNSDDLLPVDAFAGKPTQICVNVKGGTSFKFLEEDDNFMKLLAQGGANPLASVDNWARNRLNKFCKFKGLTTDVKFEDMPHAECSALLTQFFAQVKKKNGDLYPTQTLMGLYRAFTCMLQRAQEIRVQRNGVNEAPFKIRESPIYKALEVSCVLAMQRSRSEGANVPQKKSTIISLSNESCSLSHACTNPVYPRGLQARCIYYLLCCFAIQGGQKLYNLEKAEFHFGSDEAGRFVRYEKCLSKNYRVSLDQFQDEHFCPPVTSHDLDMVLTIETLISHLPVNGTYLFYQVIDSPMTNAWYSTLRVSAKKLTGFMRTLHQECGLTIDSVSNKSGRTTCVTRMALEGVPPAIGMRITGHKSQGAYTHYDRSLEAQTRAAQKCVGNGSSYGSNVEAETSLFKTRVVEGELGQQGSAKKSKLDGSVVPKQAIPMVVVKPEAVSWPDGGEAIVPATDGGDGWMDVVNWDEVMSNYDRGRMANVTPISAIFGRVANMSGCIVNITIGNFHGKEQ